MAKLSASVSLAFVTLDRRSSTPLHRQIYEGLRTAILESRLKPSTRLPSTREMALELEVSRNTVMCAFEQLFAEGYVQGKIGSGTFVSQALPDELLQARSVSRTLGRRHGNVANAMRISRRGELLASTLVNVSRTAGHSRPFRPGSPALDAFPFEIWSRLMSRQWRHPRRELLNYGEAAGYMPLRKAIARHVGAARAVRCEPEQVIVVAGAQHALDLASRVLLDPGDAAWIEEPGYLGARGALTAAGAELVPIPLDAEGINLNVGKALRPDARLIYVSPSHQYPLGITMSLARRLELLELARAWGAWILEDDYDSEYRYSGRPIAALQGLDNDSRVIYIGTFSKVLFPALRIGYLVVPESLVEPMSRARALVDRHSPTIEQAVLAEFIEDGHFARHIRKMRALYSNRQAVLVESLRRSLGDWLEVDGAAAGMHLLARLPEGIDDVLISEAAGRRGIDAQPLSAFHLGVHSRGGLVLGYASYDEAAIREGVNKLAEAIRASAVGAESQSRARA